jgi:hypothetical protein
MPNLKISAMPGLGINAAPGDLLTIVDVSAPAATANKRETLNNLLSVITRGITDKALRFQTPGTAPAVSLAAEGSIYFDGTNFQISANGGAYASLLSLSPQADHAVLIGPTSGGPTAPTWRGLTLSDLPPIATNRLLGRVSPSSPGDVEEITPGAGVLTWLQTPTSANLFGALTTKQGIGGDVVFSQAPSFQGLTSTTGMTLVGTLSAGGTLPTATAQIVFTGVSTGPFSCLEVRNATTGAVPVITVSSASTNYGLEIASKGNSTLTLKGNTVSISNNTATAGGTIEARGGTASGGGGSVRLYERSTNGSDYWAWKAPDSLSVSVVQELPDGYGNPGDGLVSDGFGVMSWAPVALTSGTLSQFAATTSAELAGVISDETGSGALVFGSSPTIATPTITTSAIIPLVNGGTAASSALTLQSTSGAGTSDAIIFRTASQLERMRILSNGNLGIGTNSPATKVEILGTANSPSLTTNTGVLRLATNISNELQIGAYPDGAFEVWLQTKQTNNSGAVFSLLMNPLGGNVGINTRNPGATLHANGTIRYTNRPAAGTVTTIGVDANGDIRESTSSERYKYDIVDYTKGLETVKQLRPREFSYNGEERRNIGFIAEEVDLLGLPEVMLYDSEGLPNAILYGNLVALLVNAIKAQQTQIDEIMETLNETA